MLIVERVLQRMPVFAMVVEEVKIPLDLERNIIVYEYSLFSYALHLLDY